MHPGIALALASAILFGASTPFTKLLLGAVDPWLMAGLLGKQEYDESIGEMKDADELINRILFLDGLPNVQRLNPIGVGENVEQILKADLALEEKALGDLREGIAYCEGVRDFVSRDLLLRILGREEEHVDFLERQFDLIKQIGIECYVMLNADAASEHGG